MSGIYIIMFAIMAVGWLVQMQLKRRFEEYSQTPIGSGLSGKDIAEKMLRDNGITDVRIISVEGKLTDHYNPMEKTVNLSHDVYYGRNAAAAAVAAHECGHAGSERSLKMDDVDFTGRSVDVANFSSIAPYRNCNVCHHYLIQLHYPAC
jgi:Zn-dependent membrane protease YugP